MKSYRPDPEDRRKHLELLQGAISRMSAASSNAKSWLLPVAAATFGYSLTQDSDAVALLGIAAVVLFATLDAQYLRQERAFRTLFRDAAVGKVAVFEMSPSRYFNKPSGDEEDRRSENCRWGKVIWSWSLAGFYAPLSMVGVVILWSALSA